MSAIDTLFHRLRASGQKAFIPFVAAGDPDLEFTEAVLRELASRGSSLCELGLPYSDPIADGPVIQSSYARALASKIHIADIFQMVRRVAPRLSAPLVAMQSYAIVYRYGTSRFVERARESSLAGLIIPDLPVEECREVAQHCAAADLSLIQLVTPTTPRERAVRIAESTTGFIYYVSVTGITGERTELPSELVESVAWLRERTPLPICIGFGISKPEHIRMLSGVADGFIVGSAIVRRIARASEASHEEVLRDVGDYAASLIAAARQS